MSFEEFALQIQCYLRCETAGTRAPHASHSCARLFAVPPAPKNVKVRRTSPTSIEVSWDEPNFPVAGYKIFYNMFATPAMYVWQQMETGPYTVADITGLEPHTVYAVRVQAKSVDGRYGNLSETVTTDVKEVRKCSWDCMCH